MTDVGVILRDTREKKPYNFSSYPVETQDEGLETGDYTIEGFEDSFAVERKTKSDFLSSITHERDRFESEVERASSLEQPLVVVIEAPKIHFRNGSYYPDIPPKAVINTMKSWTDSYNVVFRCYKGRSKAEEQTYLQLLDWSLSS